MNMLNMANIRKRIEKDMQILESKREDIVNKGTKSFFTCESEEIMLEENDDNYDEADGPAIRKFGEGTIRSTNRNSDGRYALLRMRK